jgi:hypothetical protein
MRTGKLTPSSAGVSNVGTTPIPYHEGVFENLSATTITGNGALITGISGITWESIQVFTSSGTWTKPADVDRVWVKVWGPGGTGYTNSGGGGGGYSEGIVSVSGDVTVTVGLGGSTTASSFAGDTTLIGGYGGPANNGTGGAGGTASGGTINITGGNGGNGLAYWRSGGAGYDSCAGYKGGGGASPYGGGGGAISQVGCVPGGGGGGGYASGTLGAQGMVVVYW